jgi:hypothetical protein
MTQPLFDSDKIATEWATRICGRLSDLGVTEAEIEETRVIIHAFTRTAADELSKEPSITLPYTPQRLDIQPESAHQVIELFLRGINHIAKKLRDTGKSWDERKPILENMAWKLFNLSKLLVGFLYIPGPGMQNLLSSPKDIQLMMKQSADALLEEEVNGGRGGLFPFNMNWGQR